MADTNNPVPPGQPPPVPPHVVAAGNPPAPGPINGRSAPRPAPAPSPQSSPQPATARPVETKDSYREIIETVVFVVVLVLLLKTFLAEAFVIPTGSMATTLLGYNIELTCDQCGFPYLVNASKQEDPQEGPRHQRVVGCRCPNCGFKQQLDAGGPPR